MIFWLFQQFRSVKKALAGRDRPGELAWAVALGILIGLVPKGNLVAVGLILMVLSLRLNHAMAAVTAVAVSFAAVFLDPFTHSIGQWVLEQPVLTEYFSQAWKKPLVPWTDLNNTVVMGSLVLGIVAILPAYSLSMPIFKAIAPKGDAEEDDADSINVAAPHESRTSIDVVRVDGPHENRDSNRTKSGRTQEKAA